MKNSNRNRNKKGGFFKELFTSGTDKINNTVTDTTDEVLDENGSKAQVANMNVDDDITLNGQAMKVTRIDAPDPNTGTNVYNVYTYMCELMCKISSPRWRILGLRSSNGSLRADSRSTLTLRGPPIRRRLSQYGFHLRLLSLNRKACRWWRENLKMRKEFQNGRSSDDFL